MTFANPSILYFLLLTPLLVLIFIFSERGRTRHVTSLVGSSHPALIMGAGFERRLIFMIMLCLGTALLVLAAARPQWGTKLEELHTRGFDILVAVDVSESMRAMDVSPDRISKARQEVDKFLELLSGDRVGLIAFAGSAYAFCPLTSDYGAIRLFLSGLEPGVIEDAGTNLSSAIDESIKTFERSKSTAHKVLVIFSDGEDHEEGAMDAVARAKQEDIQIFTVGIGNVRTSGDMIPQLNPDTGEETFKRDQEGKLIITRLNEEQLSQISEEGGGAYYRVSESGTELVDIYRSLSSAEEVEFSSRTHRLKEDRYQYPLGIAIVFLVAAYSLGNRSFRKLRRTQGVVS